MKANVHDWKPGLCLILCRRYTPTEFCMVVGYIAHLLALFLILCLILIDNLNGNKIALIVFIVSALLAGK